ncbi:MAG: glycosyltransferase family 4 protein [Rhodospirillaceae bacterium]|nr:glycosyltransferase family 4 protein [Rhodospirillaceae bacterium]
MPEVWFAVPGDPETRTGGYIYAKHLARALRTHGWTVHPVRLPDGFPRASLDDLAETRRLLAALPARACTLIDGLAFGAMPEGLLAGLNLDIVALVHHPLALETGLAPDQAADFARIERSALRFARAVIVTSPHTADVLAADYGVARDRIAVAVPGTDRRSRAKGTQPPSLLTVATVTPRKGHDVLVAALARIKDLAWTSCLAGSLTRAPACVADLRARIAANGIADRITLAGEVADDALAHLYRDADVFVLPSRYEGYGMVFADALAAGLPIVACAAGAVTGTVPGDAGVFVPVDDVAALADALRALLIDPNRRRGLADAAWAAGQQLPTWDRGAEIAAKTLAA